MTVCQENSGIDLYTVADGEHEKEEIEKLCDICGISDYSKIFGSNDSLKLITAKSDGIIVGFLFAVSALDETDILGIGVSPEYRKKGIGRKMLEKLINSSSSKFNLEVNVNNSAAIGLYSSLGFQAVRTIKNYYKETSDDALFMILDKRKK